MTVPLLTTSDKGFPFQSCVRCNMTSVEEHNVYRDEDVEGFFIMPKEYRNNTPSESKQILNLKTNNEIQVIYYQQVQPCLLTWNQSTFDEYITNHQFKFPNFQLSKPDANNRIQLMINNMYNVEFHAKQRTKKTGQSS